MNNLLKKLNSKLSTGLILIALCCTHSYGSIIGVADDAWKVAIRLTADDALKQSLRMSGQHLDDAAYQVALRGVKQAAITHGDAILPILRDTGYRLLEVSSKYGDDVWRYAKEVPEGARALAHNADELIPLIKQSGTDVLRLEVKTATSAGKIALHFGTESIPYFAKNIPKADMDKLLSYASKAHDPATKTLLLNKYMKGGTNFLSQLDWKQITAYGLSTSTIITAWNISSEAANSMKKLSDKIAEVNPEKLAEISFDSLETIAAYIIWPIMGFIVLVGMVKFKIIPRLKKNSQRTHNHNSP